tara:strand:+ start:1333 stop:1782 length:450 start_codon:yes stop_codon:yes gene_type:complete
MVKPKNSSEKPPYELKNPTVDLEIPNKESIEGIGKDKVEALEVVVDEIKQLIKEREKLSEDVISDAEKEKRAIDNFMLDVEAKMEAGDIEGERERISLRQKRVDVSELQLNERVDSWQDIARLKQELREKEQELSEKQSRMEMFGKILE